MVNKNFFENIYDDFFGIEKIKRENEKLAEELNLSANFPTIEVKEVTENKEENLSKEELKKLKDEHMVMLFEKIDKLYITDDSKNVLKKIIEYMRKYNEQIEKDYIAFNMCIYSDNKETINDIGVIIDVASKSFSYIKKGDAAIVSFYDIEKVEQVDEIYSEKNSVIILKDFENLIKQDENMKDRLFHKLENKLEEERSYITIIASKNEETIENCFIKNVVLKDKLTNFKIVGTKPDIQDVYQEVLQKLDENNDLTDNAKVKLLDYITITYPINSLSYPEYRDKLIKDILFSKDGNITENAIPEYEKEKTIDEIFAELNELVGLEKVKNTLNDLVNLIELKKKTEGSLKIKDVNLHMVFLGNPGTGKTTVARIIAGILYNLKYIKQNKLIEVSSKDLVAEYVGQTAPKTNAVIEKAMGGVLFIDEAYSLASGMGQGNSYNEEAVATLIQAMENHRDDLVVIFAGYT